MCCAWTLGDGVKVLDAWEFDSPAREFLWQFYCNIDSQCNDHQLGSIVRGRKEGDRRIMIYYIAVSFSPGLEDYESGEKTDIRSVVT